MSSISTVRPTSRPQADADATRPSAWAHRRIGFSGKAGDTLVKSLRAAKNAAAAWTADLLRPNMIILDEPTNHSDIDSRAHCRGDQ